MKKTIITLILCSITLFTATAQKITYNSGGMYFHGGKIKSKTFVISSRDDNGTLKPVDTLQINSGTFGFGGKIAFKYGEKGLRFGGEFYTSKATYGKHKSTYSMGWGNVFVDYMFTDRLMSYYAGVAIGLGQITNVALVEKDRKFETTEMMRYRHMTGLFTPFFGAEVNVSDFLAISLKFDYSLPFFNKGDDWARGLRVNLGTIFYLGER